MKTRGESPGADLEEPKHGEQDHTRRKRLADDRYARERTYLLSLSSKD